MSLLPKIRIVNSNNLIRVEDLLSIRESYPMEESHAESVIKRYSKELAETGNRVFFVGYDHENLPYGYVQLLTHNADSDPELADGKQIAHIHDLRIRRNIQSRGLGQGLIKFLEDEARDRGFKVLTLGVDNWNLRAVKFYNQLGYSEFKREPGRTDDQVLICMRKNI